MISSRFDGADLPPATDITGCDRERIHMPGLIQPHGCLLGCILPGWTVCTVSANAGQYVGAEPDELIGRPLDGVLPHKTVHDLRNVLQAAMVSGSAERLIDVAIGPTEARYDLTLHFAGAQAVIEIVPRDGADTLTADPVILVKSMIGRLKRAPTLERFLALAAGQVRAVTGFDRVMIYKFLPDESGQVLAESLRSGLTPYLGLRYPATDIPAQARELYRRQWLRTIPDAHYDPVPLVQDLSRVADIDLSLASLRSVSPVHRQYMRNMGTRASLTISLMDGERLWGLIACHHESPRRISSSTCAAAELFAQIFSLQIEAKEQARGLLYAAQAREIQNRLLASMPPEETLFDNLPRFADILQELIPCDGVGVFSDKGFSGVGSVPPPESIAGLVEFLNRESGTEPFASNSLSRLLTAAENYAGQVSGVLAVPFVRGSRHYLLFFRKELIRTVTWGGNPAEAVKTGAGHLSPRKSFEAWKETVDKTSTPWLPAEVQIAEALRVSLLEVILRRADIVAHERKIAEDSQNFLIAELNHRVKNILALIRSLVRQTRIGAAAVDVFADDLEQRIQALAQAHDQLTATGWKHAPLRRLLEAEARAWTRSLSRVSLSGPSVLLDSRAFQALALVFHEMMTNAAKYGALTRPSGRLVVSWTYDADRGLKIDWREFGGPTVKPPSRRGFGSVVVEQTIPFELGGQATLDYRHEGLCGAFLVPAVHVTEAEFESETAAPPPVSPPLSLKRLLLVEDSMMIALDAQAMLGEAGLDVEVAGTVADATRLLDVEAFDGAVLDINLSGETSFGVADALQRLGMPFVFATGYGESVVLPDHFKAVPVVSKPYDQLSLKSALASLDDAAESSALS